jgi:phenylalanyl-tRNA synthetase alpha chain
MEKLNRIKEEFNINIKNIKNSNELKDFKSEFLGKNGYFSSLMQNLKDLSLEEKKNYGSEVNKFKVLVEEKIVDLEKKIKEQEIKQNLKGDYLDITIPPREIKKGSIHPITKVKKGIQEIFYHMGFSITDGGVELEDDWHNFEALNTPQNHPARQMQDTFFMSKSEDKKEYLLRTQSTATTVREMERKKPPYKFISLGKTYRRDMDATHLPMFSQIDMQYIGKDATLANLKYLISEFCRKFFEIDNVTLRFRPSYFPFTAPSLEVDIKCTKEGGKIVKFGEGNNWCEIGGSGMTHPNVIKNVGLNPDEWQGFAFGFGIERMAMLKYGISDMRHLYEGDLRFLKHYSFKSF